MAKFKIGDTIKENRQYKRGDWIKTFSGRYKTPIKVVGFSPSGNYLLSADSDKWDATMRLIDQQFDKVNNFTLLSVKYRSAK